MLIGGRAFPLRAAFGFWCAFNFLSEFTPISPNTFPNFVNHQNVGTNSAPNFPPETKGTFLQRRHILQSKLSEDLGLTIFGRHLVFTPLMTNILLVPPLSLLIPNFFREYHIFGQCVLANYGERTI